RVPTTRPIAPSGCGRLPRVDYDRGVSRAIPMDRRSRSDGARLRWSPLAIAMVGVALGTLAVFLIYYFQRGFIPGDATVYLAAGERLDAGHALYALAPGDRDPGLKPPYWTVPLLSPPLIGVVFRPLALLPWAVGAYIFWAATLASIAI